MLAHPEFDRLFALLKGAKRPPLVGFNGLAFRACEPKWMSRPYRLTGVGAVLRGGRWNVVNLVPALNFGETDAVTAAEADWRAKLAHFAPGSFSPQTRVGFDLVLQSLLDLTDSAVLKALSLKKTDLTTCDWDAAQTAGDEALTQAVGRAAFETLAEGLIAPSARLKGGRNIVVFPTHLKPGSSITARDESKIPHVKGL